MKRWLLVPLSLLMVLAVLGVVGCQSKPKKLVVGTSADYEPFEYVDENGSYTGFDIELMEEIGKRMGVEIEWQDIAFDGLIGALQSGKIDAIIAAMSATPEREEQVDFTKPYFIGADAIIVAEGSGITITKNEDMAGLRVGVQSGTIQEQWIDENIDADVQHYERAEQAILDLKSGRIDVVAMDYYAAQNFIEQGGIEMALKTEFAGEHMAIAVKEGNTELRDQLNEIIDELQAEGFVDNLAMKYLGGGE
ncbi:MAG TPA: basic amino acid ABC transporter substrate-binding protein [Chloroflexi bacterium]|nr:basic amino acid ABC transporter substrate-binding protein [Chloroflexota bacterium]